MATRQSSLAFIILMGRLPRRDSFGTITVPVMRLAMTYEGRAIFFLCSWYPIDRDCLQAYVIARSQIEMIIAWLIFMATWQSFSCVYHPDGEIATAR